MSRVQFKVPVFVVFVLLLAAIAAPSTAFAAGSPPAAQANDNLAQTGTGQNEVVLPGILSLIFGVAQTGQLDIPPLNATASVSGLNFANGVTYESINVNQKSPSTVQDWLVSNAQLSIGAPANGFSSIASGHLALQPPAATTPLVEGTVALAYDGVSKQMGLGVQDANAYFAAGPAVVTVAGLNRLPGDTSAQSIQVAIPAANTTVQMEGLNNSTGALDWNSLTVAQSNEATLGGMGLSGLQARVYGPSTGYSTDATLHYTLGNGTPAQAEGQLIASYDGVNRTMTFQLQNASASVTTPGFNLAMAGLDYGNTGVQIDSITFALPGANVSGELDNVTSVPGGGVTFDKATVKYAPDQASASASGSRLAGFEFTITKTDTGYLLATNTAVSPK